MVTKKRLYSESCHFLVLAGVPYKCDQCSTIRRTLKEDQPLRLLMNLFFYHFNRVRSIKCECSKLDIVNNLFLHEHAESSFNLWGDLTDHMLLKVDF